MVVRLAPLVKSVPSFVSWLLRPSQALWFHILTGQYYTSLTSSIVKLHRCREEKSNASSDKVSMNFSIWRLFNWPIDKVCVIYMDTLCFKWIMRPCYGRLRLTGSLSFSLNIWPAIAVHSMVGDARRLGEGDHEIRLTNSAYSPASRSKTPRKLARTNLIILTWYLDILRSGEENKQRDLKNFSNFSSKDALKLFT